MFWVAYVCAVRNALGMSQGDLAAILGVNRTTLMRLEQGVAPLKFALCKSAVQVFKEAGVTSKAMDELIASIGVPPTLDITIQTPHLLKMRSKVAMKSTPENKATLLLGENFSPPLDQSPLRKR